MAKISKVEKNAQYDALEARVREVARKNKIVIGKDAIITDYSYGSWGDIEIRWIKNGFCYSAKREGYRGY